MLDFLKWYLFITVFGWVSFPIAFHFLPGLKDRGFTLARALFLILWGFSFWILASFHVLQNNLGGTILALVVLVAISGYLAHKNWQEIGDWVKSHRGLIISAEILFLLLFACWTVVRAANPNIEGTEKPMELAFINAILRSPSIPPNDPWLSGYAISYYYFGYLMIAMLTRVTGVISGVAFNLSAALWFALTGIGAFGIVFNLLSRLDNSEKSSKKVADFSAGNLGWSLLGPFFVLVISNAEGFLEYLHARGLFWSRSADGSLVSKFWKWLDILELNSPPVEPFSWTPNRPAGILFWRASRVLSDYDLAGNWKEIIDEFPFFSYILADLHPHVLAMPFVLLAISLALNFLFNENHSTVNGFAWKHWFASPDFWMLALVFGGLGFLNTWDFPIYVAGICLVFVLQRYRLLGWNFQRILDFAGFGLLLGLLGIILYFPFYVGFSSQAGGFMPSLNYFTRGIHFWVMFTPLLVPIFGFVFWIWKGDQKKGKWRIGIIWSAICIFGLWLISYLLSGLIGVFPIIGDSIAGGQSSPLRNIGEKLIFLANNFFAAHGNINFSYLLGGSFLQRFKFPGTWLTLGILLVMIWGLLYSTRNREETAGSKIGEWLKHPSVQFCLLLILLGCGLTLVPEFVYLIDQFGWRMNTIFKFYFQAWIVWGLAAAFGSAIILKHSSRSWKIGYGFVLPLVFIVGLAYPSFALPATTNSFKPDQWTLDGTGFYSRYEPEEAEAIQWLSKAPYGYVVEAVGGQYSGYARVSKFSGLPAVLGWPGHESQWRGGYIEMGSRGTDIETLFVSNRWEDALAVIRNYDIRYIYIGSLERSSMKVDEKKFFANLPVVFQNNAAVIFEVPKELQEITVE